MDDHASAALLQSAIAALNAMPSSPLHHTIATSNSNTTTTPSLPPALLALPRRRPHPQRPHAQRVAELLFPTLPPVTALIRYEEQRKRAVAAYRALTLALTQAATATARRRREAAAVGGRRPWKGPLEDPVEMPRAVPMPVVVGKEEDFRDCFAFLRRGGVVEDAVAAAAASALLNGGAFDVHKEDIHINSNMRLGTEPIHGVPLVEFPRGVVYADGRLDLCKMVVGPDHIDALMDALSISHSSSSSSSSSPASSPSPSQIRHFLLGNNIITNHGARRIARFITAHPSRIQTWYLAGNHIKPSGFHALATALQHSPALTNLWLKRNPLGAASVPDLLALLHAPAHRLRVLDLETCELGDAGVAALFDGLLMRMMMTTPPPNTKSPTLEAIYLNGNGIATQAATSIARFLASPRCTLTHLFLTANPLADSGARALAPGLAANTTLEVLTLASCGLSSAGVSALCDALASNPLSRLRSLDLSSRFTTVDLGQRCNYIGDGAVESLRGLVHAGAGAGAGAGGGTGPLRFLKLGHVAMSERGLERLRDAVADEAKSSLVEFEATRIEEEPVSDKEEEVHRQDNHQDNHQDKQQKAPPRSCSLRVRRALEQNYRRLYASSGSNNQEDATSVPYASFISSMGPARLLRNHPDVRLIDSVYRTRDTRKGRVRKFWDLESNEEEIVLWRRLDAME